MSFSLNVIYTMKPGKRERFLELVEQKGLQASVRGEAGCLQYDYYCPVGRADQLLLVERWTDREAQQVHLSQPHMACLAQIKEECVDHTRVERYELE